MMSWVQFSLLDSINEHIHLFVVKTQPAADQDGLESWIFVPPYGVFNNFTTFQSHVIVPVLSLVNLAHDIS